MNFYKNDLIDETLDRFYQTFSHTLDTADYVPDKFNKKIDKYIFKNLKKSFKCINKEDRIYQNQIKKQIKLEKRLERKEIKKQNKLKRKEKLKNFFSKLKFKKKKV